MDALDPTLPHMFAALLAIVFLGGAWQKLRDMDGFVMAVEQYRLLPASWAMPAAWALLAAEAVAGLLLLPLATRTAGAALALAVLAAVTLAVAINLLRGRHAIDCGCGGPEGGQHLSWGLVLRNGLLGLAAVLSLAAEAPRDLVWLDGLTLVAGTLALYGLYAAANQLMANRPRLMKLRG
ncbi:MAG: MauE/DoxX family redox-associated membrane protein [Denitratisoma sp.]|nr:MauE/DoxX family redox-associated membrane protein [Denitratisoma sp.]